MGLDEKAIEAVQKWRFKPGIREENRPLEKSLLRRVNESSMRSITHCLTLEAGAYTQNTLAPVNHSNQDASPPRRSGSPRYPQLQPKPYMVRSSGTSSSFLKDSGRNPSRPQLRGRRIRCDARL